MTGERYGEVRQGIVIGLGRVGGRVLASLDQRLVARHNGIPTIRLLALDAGQGGRDRSGGTGEIQALDLSFDPERLPDPTRSAISRWLPDGESVLAQPEQELQQTRLGGRIALFQHANRVHVAIREATNVVLSVATRSDLEPRSLRVKDESALDVYVIAALDEPFASGTFIDLAYLVAHTLEFELAVKVFPQITGVLFLPAFRTSEGVAGQAEEEILARREAEQVNEADAYAALKELDYYMDKRRYQAAYTAGLTFSHAGPPFTQSCYLIDTMNEQNKGMPSLEQTVEMVAEWMYNMLASPLKDGFQGAGIPAGDVRSRGKVAAYSGLGLAAYFLPIKEVIDLSANRMAHEMVRDYFLSQPPEEKEIPAASFGVQPQEIQDRLRDDKAWEVKRDPYVNVQLQHFANIAPHDLTRLEGMVRRSFDARLNQLLPRLRKGMGVNLGEMLDDFQKRLAEFVAQNINLSPTGGIVLVRRFLNRMKGQLEEAQRRADDEGRARGNERREAENRIRDDRANHVASVHTFNTRTAILCLAASLLAIFIFLYYAELTFLNKLGLISTLDFRRAPVIAAIVVIIGNLMALGTAGYIAWDWWRRSRHDYIESHRRRLGLAWDVELKGVEADYYRRAQEVVDQQLEEVMGFQERLEDLEVEFAEAVKADRPLYGAPRFAIEESVIDEQDADRFYRELVGDSLEDEIGSLFAEYRPFYEWRDEPDEAIFTALRRAGNKKFEILRQTKSAEALLVQHATQSAATDARLRDRMPTDRVAAPDNKGEVRRRLKRLLDNSMPFLRYSDLELGPGVSTNAVHHVGFEGARNTDSLVYQILEEQHISKLLTADRHRIVSMTARHVLPLAAVGALRRWRMQYESLRGASLRQLHTQRSHLALPDIFPLAQDTLQPQMAVAMGLVYGKLTLLEEDGHLGFSYEDDLEETVEVDLGAEKLDACIYLQDNPVVLRILSDRIGEETINRSEDIGNRALIDFLRKHARRMRREGQMEDWEQIMVDDYVAQLER